MKKLCIVCLHVMLLSATVSANNETKGISYKLVPTLSSNPTSGTGIGAVGIGIYKVDKESSPSQAIINAQYSNTDSYNLFLINKMFFNADKWQSNSVAGLIYNNSNYSFPSEILPILPPSINPDDGIQFNVAIYVAMQQFLYAVKKHFYVGAQFFYIDQKFDANNKAGEAFLQEKGIEDSNRGGYGLTAMYDSRSKQERFYATNSSFVGLNVNQFPEFLGIKESYYNAILNARKYIHGFKESDVFAMQLYGQYSSEDTPDGALSALGSRSILRGFPIGLYKARNMLATQGEYRYKIDSTSFRLTVFGGFANLNGGSKGNGEGNNREEDNGNYYSGGLGVHYILEKKQQLDYRVNVAYTNDEEVSFYASLNQAF